MKAAVYTQFGPPTNLQWRDIPKPAPKAGEVLVKVWYTAINDYDWSMVTGKPGIYRLLFGLFRPRNPIPGMEFSGTIEETGPDVSGFAVGDAVYGDTSEARFGTFAEYICLPEKALVHKPASISFPEAAATSHASMLAWQGLFDVGNLKTGEKVLINGAGGGVGTFGLQLAKLHGAEVSGVDTGEKLDMMRTLGFDKVIDYQETDFTRTGEQYDLILDTKTTRSPRSYLRALRPGGRYATVGGTPKRIIQLLLAHIRHRNLSLVALKPNKDLEAINQLYDERKIRPIIDGPYPKDMLADRLQYFGDGLHSGKVIIAIAGEE